MAGKKKAFGKCGFFALILMCITGAIFGGIGVCVAHALMRYFTEYYLILIPPVIMAILMGIGLSTGAKIGRCSRFSIFAFLLATVFAVGSYASLLFMNFYHDSFEEPPTILAESLSLSADSWNLLAELPFVSDYVDPVTEQRIQEFLGTIPVVADWIPQTDAQGDVEQVSEDGAETAPATHLGNHVLEFVNWLQVRAFEEEPPVLIGTVFDLVLFVPVKQYLLIPGITKWEGGPGAETGENSGEGSVSADSGPERLVFDAQAVKPWMAWAVEGVFVWMFVVLLTRGGTKKAYRKLQKRLEKRAGAQSPGLQMHVGAQEQEEEPAKKKKEKRSWFSRKKKPKKTEAIAEDVEVSDTEESQPVAQEDTSKKKKKKEKKKGGGWFGRKKKAESEETEGAAVTGSNDGDVEFEFSDNEEEEKEEQTYALILHQFTQDRQSDLLQLIQQVGQVNEDRARRLLKVPSLIQRDLTAGQATIAIEKFNQVQAQVKLITMEQLAQLQKKQQQVAQPSSPAAASPVSSGGSAAGDRYALVLRKFDQAQRKQVLELLSSISKTPANQLQQSLKTPALVLRDASKDEVTMIAQQFQKIHADVKMLTMAELQKLMTRK